MPFTTPLSGLTYFARTPSDGYERLFIDLVAALPVRRGTDRRSLRLMLLGALNWSQTWYRPGRDDPRAIARSFVALLRTPFKPE